MIGNKPLIAVEQLRSFKEIAQTLQWSMENNQIGFVATATGLKRTIEQTRPRGLFGSPQIDLGQAQIGNGKSFTYNVSAINIGNDTARDFRLFAAMYLGEPDDLKVQSKLYDHFELDWKEGSNKPGIAVAPGSPLSFVTFISPSIDQASASKIQLSKLTLYVLSRISYRDGTGNWYSDSCSNMQVPLQPNGAPFHDCDARYNNKRYKPMRQ